MNSKVVDLKYKEFWQCTRRDHPMLLLTLLQSPLRCAARGQACFDHNEAAGVNMIQQPRLRNSAGMIGKSFTAASLFLTLNSLLLLF
jgi:hypothetical protein